MRGHIVVAGAGVAGLRAALELAQAGLQVTVMESRDRVGGRIFSEQVAGCNVEMGAEFIHGLPHETLSLLERYELEYYELDGDFLLYDGRGGVEAQDESDETTSPSALLERMREWADLHPHQDMSFRAWVAMQAASDEASRHASAFVEGFNAADASVIGVQGLAKQQRAEDEIDGARAFHVRGGYAQLPLHMAEELRSMGVEIALHATVTAVATHGSGVTVTTKDGRSVEADAAVIATPLGTLLQGSIQWSPPIDQILAPAHQLVSGTATRIALIFNDRWWSALGHEAMSFLLPKTRHYDDDRPRFEVFWTPYPALEPMITAWAGGATADRFESMTQQQIAAIALADLEDAFGLASGSLHDALAASRWHPWMADPNTLGAYSFVPSGALDAVEAMTHPVGNRLFFAGEHTDTTGHWGTVHGAIRSGVRAAQQVIDLLSRGKAVDNKK